MARPDDRRDIVTGRVQALVDHTIDEPAQQRRIAELLFGDQPVGGPPGTWPAPTAAERQRARAAASQAATEARHRLQELGIAVLYTTLRELPAITVTWRPIPPERELPMAPLIYQLADARSRRVMATLAAYVFTKHTRDIWDADIHAHLMRRLNAFAQVEIDLWSFAADAGHTDPRPTQFATTSPDGSGIPPSPA